MYSYFMYHPKDQALGEKETPQEKQFKLQFPSFFKFHHKMV